MTKITTLCETVVKLQNQVHSRVSWFVEMDNDVG